MKKWSAIVLGTWLCAWLPVSAAAGCDYPRAPLLPDGETVSEEDMRAVQADVRAFLAAAEEYLACLADMEKDPSSAPLSARQAEINVARHNAMVDEMHRVSDEYNVAVRIFKARQ